MDEREISQSLQLMDGFSSSVAVHVKYPLQRGEGMEVRENLTRA